MIQDSIFKDFYKNSRKTKPMYRSTDLRMKMANQNSLTPAYVFKNPFENLKLFF